MSVYEGHGVTLHHADCLDVLRSLPDCSVDSVVTDPPYNLTAGKKGGTGVASVNLESPYGRSRIGTGNGSGGFMGQAWDDYDHFPGGFYGWCEAWATECLRVLKPGGHLLAFGGTRTWHRLACAVEDAGFEVRDSIARFHSIDMNNAAQLMEVWQEWTERVPSAGLRFRELGGSSAGDRVLLEPSHDESPARALIADLCSSGHPPTPAETWPSVASNVGAGSTASSALVTIAGASPESRGQQPGTTGSSAPSDAPEWLAASREATTRAAEALRIWLGAKPSSRPGATDALCAALSNALKHITCAHSETFRSYDTTWQTVCVSATTATTTASTAANLLAFTADTLAGLDPEEVMPLEADSGPLAWVYGSGFPRLKSLDVSKAIDKRRTEDAEPVRAICRAIRAAMDVRDLRSRHLVEHFDGCHPRLIDHWAARDTDSQPALPTWEQWEKLRDLFAELAEHDAEAWRLNGRKGSPGEAWESAEVIGTARGIDTATSRLGFVGATYGGTSAAKDYDVKAPASSESQSWQGWGTALKPAFEPVVVARKPLTGTVAANVLEHGTGALNIGACRIGLASGEDVAALNARSGGRRGFASEYVGGTDRPLPPGADLSKGRWPANVVLDEEMARRLDEQSGEQRDGTAVKRNRSEDGRAPYDASSYMITDSSREDHGYGGQGGASRFFYVAKADATERPRVNGTAHPTVKPLSLMRWLVRLVTPPGGTVLEPFAGSGTTVEACIVEGFDCIAIEKGEEYLPLIMQRIHRRRDPVAAIRQTGDELGLFELDGEGA